VSEQTPDGHGPARTDALANRRAARRSKGYWLDKTGVASSDAAAGPAAGGGSGAAAPAASGTPAQPADRQARAAVIDAAYRVPVDAGVFSWMDADPVQVAGATARTARFVEWLSAVFEVREIPACWSAHPAIMFELWALERFHRQVFVTGEDLSGPVAWCNQLAAVRARLREEYKAAACQTEAGHQNPIGKTTTSVRARRARYTSSDSGGAQPVLTWWGWPATDDANQPVTWDGGPVPEALAAHYRPYTTGAWPEPGHLAVHTDTGGHTSPTEQ
jgi:hypothetical protein